MVQSCFCLRIRPKYSWLLCLQFSCLGLTPECHLILGFWEVDSHDCHLIFSFWIPMTYQGSPKSVMKSSLHLYLQQTRRTFVQICPWPAISASRFHSFKYTRTWDPERLHQLLSNASLAVVTSQELDRAGFANDCSLHKADPKEIGIQVLDQDLPDLQVGGYLDIWVTERNSRIATPSIYTNCIQYSQDRHSPYYSIWWTNKCAELSTS